MELQTFLDYLNQGNTVVSGSEYSLMMHKLAQEALQITTKLNNAYHTPEEICEIFSRLTGKPVSSTFSMFPPFYTDCGKNITVGEGVFINSGGRCHDNARCEAMWARMKEGLLYGRYDTKKMTIEELKTLIWRYFIIYWNNRRICSANGGLPPMVKRKRYYESLEKAA